MPCDLEHYGVASDPLCVGTGLVALDVLVNGRTDGLLRLWAGGSCGNVLTILSYLGWQSFPIANLGVDKASETILNDMRRWNVKTDFVCQSQGNITPIIIERLSNNGSSAIHEFKFKCPVCGSPLPRNRPLPNKLMQRIISRIPNGRVFYFDRISKAAIEFAKKQRSQGALIVFEPCKFSSRRLFKESLKVAHILKYSRDQIDGTDFEESVLLEIQTLGAEGLRYKFGGKEGESLRWKKMSAFQVLKIVDSAGAGDWCTAGIIHMIGQDGVKGFLDKSVREVEEALRFGQMLAALKCGYEGARGLMYNLERRELQSIICRLTKDEHFELTPPTTTYKSEQDQLRNVCPACAGKVG
jgi:fructokinase